MFYLGWGKCFFKFEYDLFLGFLFLVFIGIEVVFDINCFFDEYINDFLF